MNPAVISSQKGSQKKTGQFQWIIESQNQSQKRERVVACRRWCHQHKNQSTAIQWCSVNDAITRQNNTISRFSSLIDIILLRTMLPCQNGMDDPLVPIRENSGVRFHDNNNRFMIHQTSILGSQISPIDTPIHQTIPSTNQSPNWILKKNYFFKPWPPLSNRNQIQQPILHPPVNLQTLKTYIYTHPPIYPSSCASNNS